MRATTEYAIRIMSFLAKAKGVASSSDIAAATEISQKYLTKIAVILRDHDLILSSHGYNGGYVLARPAGEITMWQIVSAVDMDGWMIKEYDSHESANDADDAQPTHRLFHEMNRKMRAYLASITLDAFCAQDRKKTAPNDEI